jgi:hypothetical protein
MNNLVHLDLYQVKRNELRIVLRNNQREIRDIQIFPEAMLLRRSKGTTPYDFGQTLKQEDYDRFLHAAESATNRKTGLKEIIALTNDSEEVVRYWGSIGLLLRLADTAGSDGTQLSAATEKLYAEIRPVVLKLREDSSPNVKIVASEILGRFGTESDVDLAVKNLLILIPHGKETDTPLTQTVLAAIDSFASRLKQYRSELEALQNMKFSTRSTATVESLIHSICRQVSKDH